MTTWIAAISLAATLWGVHLLPTPLIEKTTEWPVVERVIDGDTIEVRLPEAGLVKVRLLGVDTPETVDPRRKVQCFGKEASQYTKNLLLNKPVRLELDATQGDKDKYGRLLRYVYLLDGTMFNARLVAAGYAYVYTRYPTKFQSQFLELQRQARQAGRGLWSQKTCQGAR